MYQAYPRYKIIARRMLVIVLGVVALPVMLFRPDRARFYSYLHRVWCKTSAKPVWLAQSEAAGDLFW
ncbi:YbfA family protein [Pantoea sp. C2G6]|uniref:YbfA family protein n=1 Tax=Pantoea sp. C2G6 TaxID=3243084 RepID=UPI003ED88206